MRRIQFTRAQACQFLVQLAFVFPANTEARDLALDMAFTMRDEGPAKVRERAREHARWLRRRWRDRVMRQVVLFARRLAGVVSEEP